MAYLQMVLPLQLGTSLPETCKGGIITLQAHPGRCRGTYQAMARTLRQLHWSSYTRTTPLPKDALSTTYSSNKHPLLRPGSRPSQHAAGTDAICRVQCPENGLQLQAAREGGLRTPGRLKVQPQQLGVLGRQLRHQRQGQRARDVLTAEPNRALRASQSSVDTRRCKQGERPLVGRGTLDQPSVNSARLR